MMYFELIYWSYISEPKIKDLFTYRVYGLGKNKDNKVSK